MCTRYSKASSNEQGDYVICQAKMGGVIHQGHWKENYPALLTVSINEKLYIYGQSEQKNWFMREIFSNGSISDWDSSIGVRARFYQTNFPFSINGRHFYFCINQDEKLWYIVEILEDGKVGNVTDSGSDGDDYTKVPFSIAGKQFYYSQKNNNWYINTLSSDGKLGERIQSSQWNAAYKTALIFSANDKNYVYCAGKDKWFIQEILYNAKMGPQTDQGFWSYDFDLSLAFSLRGKQYSYAESGLFWVIRELLAGGKMGPPTDSGYWERKYDVILPFSIKGKTFIYGNFFKDKSWFIREIVIQC